MLVSQSGPPLSESLPVLRPCNRRRQHGDERQGESYVGACQLQFELPSTATHRIPSLQNATSGSGATQRHQDLFIVRWYKEMPSWARTSER